MSSITFSINIVIIISINIININSSSSCRLPAAFADKAGAGTAAVLICLYPHRDMDVLSQKIICDWVILSIVISTICVIFMKSLIVCSGYKRGYL